MPANRQLAAILFTDIEGYTASMQLDERIAIALRDRHREILEKEHINYNGRIIQYYGDGTLSIFQSAVEAVQCAIAMQQTFRSRPMVPVRMGLHLGDIIFNDGHIYGDGVNFASRVESMSIPGSVLISDKVNEEIHNHPELGTVSVGTYQLKNIQRQVEIFALTHEGLTIPLPHSLKGKTEEKKLPVLQEQKKPRLRPKSIAVLPFRNISNDNSLEWLTDGFTEELTSAIAGISDLKVKSSTAMRQYRNSGKSFDHISEELNVANFIEGAVQKQGNEILINANLINSKTGEILRPFRFRKDFSEINFIYSQMAQEIAENLNAILHSTEKQRFSQTAKVNARVYQLFLQGRHAAQKLDNTEILEAIKRFGEALGIEPDYAPALAGLANCYVILGYLNAISPAQVVEKTGPLLEKALALDPNLAFAHSNQAWVKMWFQWDLENAEKEFIKANSLDPSDVNCIQGIFLLNLYYGNISNAEYWEETGRAVAPHDFWLNLFRGLLLFIKKKNKEAVAFLKNCNASYDHPFYKGRMGWIYNLDGHFEDAIDILEKAMKQMKRPAVLSWAAAAYYQNNNKEKAAQLFDDLEKKVRDGAINHAVFVAGAYAFIGKKDKALYFLNKAYELHDIDLLWIKTDPMFDSVRTESEFKVVSKKLRLD